VPSFRVWCSSACMFFPINSVGSSYPSMRAAERFEKRQVPSESQPQIASVAESRIRRIRSSLLCRRSSACLRIALSSERGMVGLRLLRLRNTMKFGSLPGPGECASRKHLGYHCDQCNLTQVPQSTPFDTTTRGYCIKNPQGIRRVLQLSANSYAIVSRARTLLDGRGDWGARGSDAGNSGSPCIRANILCRRAKRQQNGAPQVGNAFNGAGCSSPLRPADERRKTGPNNPAPLGAGFEPARGSP
jgi:hypothetical protein